MNNRQIQILNINSSQFHSTSKTGYSYLLVYFIWAIIDELRTVTRRAEC